MMRVGGKIALITGGTSGIGAETARLLAREGATVVITGRSVDKGQALAEEIGEAARFFEADVTNEADIKASVDAVVTAHGRLDIMFNNAGASPGASLDTLTQEMIGSGCHLLLSSVMLGTRFAAEAMAETGGGVIVNNASIAGHRFRQGDILYSTLKAAVAHFTRLAAVELGPRMIRVNAVSPGAIATPIFWGGSARANTLSAEENAAKLDKLKANLAKAAPLPMAGEPADIAEAVLYLAADSGRFVTGHDLVVDGGRIMMFNEMG